MNNGNGKRRYRRLPDNIDNLLGTWLAREIQNSLVAREIYEMVDADTARAIRELIELIINNAEKTANEILDDTDTMKDLMIELRDLRDLAARCGE